MKFKRRISFKQFLLRGVCITLGVCGGWLAGGVLNNHRNDLPLRVVPAQPPATMPVH